MNVSLNMTTSTHFSRNDMNKLTGTDKPWNTGNPERNDAIAISGST